MDREVLAEHLEAEALAVIGLDHEIALVARHADHGMAEIQRHLAAERLGGGLHGLDIDTSVSSSRPSMSKRAASTGFLSMLSF